MNFILKILVNIKASQLKNNHKIKLLVVDTIGLVGCIQPQRLSLKAQARFLSELTRPWKLITLSVGIAMLIAGSYFYPAPDWDIPISFIMAILTYLTAPWSIRVLIERQWKYWPAMLFGTWFTVDGCYAIYWHFVKPEALEMREANFPASLSLYAICGFIWLYRGSLAELFSELQVALKGRKPSKK